MYTIGKKCNLVFVVVEDVEDDDDDDDDYQEGHEVA